MAVTAASRHAPPRGQRSPTLSDAGMILPALEADFDRATSPIPHIERPPSPSDLYRHADSSPRRLSSGAQSRRRASQQISFPSLSAQSSRSTLRNAADSVASSRSMSTRDHVLASSPTIHTAPSSHSPGSWRGQDQRKVSPSSSSVFSEDFEHWPGFDSHETFEDSGVDLEEQEKRNRSRTETEGADVMPANASDDDDDPYSSAALSRRAEIILANAKKRLNVMEGNLRGARESLVVSPTFSSKGLSSDLPHHMAASRERDRRLYAGMGPIPPRLSSYRQSLLMPSGNSGHSRNLSETSVPLPFTPSYMSRKTSIKRASSAFGHTSGPWAPESYGQGRFPIKESRSVDHLRDPRNTWTNSDRDHVVVAARSSSRSASRSASRSSKSPPVLETLQEDEDGARIHRSTSAASGLRDQMNDLKGRISSLKLKAQEDHLRRRSMQSLRAPSPFTAADTWNTHASESHNTRPTGLGITTETATRTGLYPEEQDRPTSATTTTSQLHGENLVRQCKDQSATARGHGYAAQSYQEREGDLEESEAYAASEVDDGEDVDDSDFVSVYGEDADGEPESVYEDAVYEMPTTERHEDRVDAFDYETFFLHSAMGTYSQGDRRSSTSSGTSTATTRPVTAVQTGDEVSKAEKRMSFHQRNPSADSVSTVATFATAAEDQGDEDGEEDEEENEQMDQFSQQLLSNQSRVLSPRGVRNSHLSLRSDSAINLRSGNGVSPPHSSLSRGSPSPAEFASGVQTSKLFSVLTEGSRDEPRIALSDEETQLVYGLAAGIQHVCSQLQSTYGEAYERKALRRRLDEARKILMGEDLEDGQPS